MNTNHKTPTKIKIGDSFNKLTVIGFDGKDKNGFYTWSCQCNCENKTIIHNIPTCSLTSGNTKSCGCLQKEATIKSGKERRKLNSYNLTGDYGIGYTYKNEPFYFDLEDYDKIKNYVWKYNPDKYVIATQWINNKPHMIRMHRFILDEKDSKVQIDHNDHVPYNNRKNNLRKCPHNKNSMNHKKRTDNTSGVTGVYWDKEREKWLVAININKKMKYIGRFLGFDEAVQARKDAEKKYYKEFQYNPKEDKYNKEK